MRNYTKRQINRFNMPEKSILVVEDCLLQQARFAAYFLGLFGHQSNVFVNFCSNAIDADSLVFSDHPPVLIILDHDLQWGNGVELITKMIDSKLSIPIITASGIPANNTRMMSFGATHEFYKDEIIRGEASKLILSIIGGFKPCPKP